MRASECLLVKSFDNSAGIYNATGQWINSEPAAHSLFQRHKDTAYIGLYRPDKKSHLE